MPDLPKMAEPLIASQRDCAIINLRGAPTCADFANGIQAALGMSLPTAGCFNSNGPNRLIWVGPDDWFFIGLPGSERVTLSVLDKLKADCHCAVTDVTGGYELVTLSGPQAADMLASGCPLDFHFNVFTPGRVAGSHFYQTAITVWMTDSEPRFELLVRRSFSGYFWQVLTAATQECGLQRQDMV